jgi:hypothetical protein
MSVARIEQAVQQAIEVRGVVMLAARENDRQWCAVCAAVDGSLELRVGEPGGGWRRRGEKRAREAWLRENGFVQVVDAWSKPVTSISSTWSCAQLLDDALREGLGAPSDADLIEVLVHPGVIGDAAPPPPDAPHVEHLRFALSALARRGRGKLSVEAGRPSSTWAWAFVSDGALLLSPETPADDDEWTVSLAEDEVVGAADRLTALLHEQLGLDPRAPLFISCMPREPGEPPLL